MFNKRSTREIVASKRTIGGEPRTERTKIDSSISSQSEAVPGETPIQQPQSDTTLEKKHIPKWLLPVIGVAVIALAAVVFLSGWQNARRDVFPESTVEQNLSIISVYADAALADFVVPGDVVRLYDTEGNSVETLQYVEVYKSTVFNQLLLLVDDVQASAVVTQPISPKMVVVAHREPEKAVQMLNLQERINNPTITLTLPKFERLQPDEEKELTPDVTISPLEAILPPIQWETSDESIVAVDNGRITANGLGEATITATCGGVTAKCQVTVSIPLDGITLSQSEAAMGIGDTLSLSAAPQPENTTEFEPIWASTDSTVATVDESGNITAVAAGTTTIVVTSGSTSVSCEITVGSRADVVKLDKDKLNLKVSEMAQLYGTIYPEGNIDTPKFESSDPAIATVAEDGTVTGVAPGSCTITFRAGAAETTCTVTVTA